jgi:(E)-4-hydroxy-3-methylbut-2-enyl-diphosphate synthase
MPTLERPNPQQPYPEPVYPRRPTRTVAVGEVLIGSQHPVVVQSMINEDVLNIDAAVAAIRRLHEAGSEIVRVTVPSLAHAKAMEVIRERLIQTYKPVPLVADVHHNGLKVALEVAKYVDKVRINPGLFVVEKPQPGRTEYTKAELEAIRSEIREAFVPLYKPSRPRTKPCALASTTDPLPSGCSFSTVTRLRGWWNRPWSMPRSALSKTSTM